MNNNFNYNIQGEKQTRDAIDKSVYKVTKTVFEWIKDERDLLVGSKAGKSRRRVRGIREIIANKPRKSRKGKWGRSLAAQWKGKVTGVPTGVIGKMGFEAGLFASKKGIKKSMVRMHWDYSYTTNKFMIVPIHKNLKKIGYTGPFFSGKFSTGLKNKAFQNLKDKLCIIFKDGKIYYYNKAGYNRKRKKFKKSDLLFIGVKRIIVGRVFKGKYDIRERFTKQMRTTTTRAEKALTKTIKKINKG